MRLSTYKEIEKEAHERCHLEMQIEKLEAQGNRTCAPEKESAE